MGQEEVSQSKVINNIIVLIIKIMIHYHYNYFKF